MSINHQTTGCERLIRMSRVFLSMKSLRRAQLIENELRTEDWQTENRRQSCRRDCPRFPFSSDVPPGRQLLLPTEYLLVEFALIQRHVEILVCFLQIVDIQAPTMPDSESAMSCSQQSENLRNFCVNSSAGSSTSCEDVKIFAFSLMVDCYFKQVFYSLASMLIFIGTILNLFSLYCFWKMNKRHSTNVYLSVLSLGDTINLHVNFTLPLVRRWGLLDNAFRSSLCLCRIMGVLTEFFLIFPTWIVVLLTMEPLIPILWPSKRHVSYAQRRAKLSVVALIIIVFGLSLYRLYDLKGIDQVSVFSVVACNGSTEETVPAMRNFNLIIWSILPECFTLVLSLIIVYKIKVAKKHFNKADSKAVTAKYNQATKTVLLISILFFVFHTPTGELSWWLRGWRLARRWCVLLFLGILIALDLIYLNNERTVGIVIILVSRKLTVLLYEISLCCKFFIYNQTFSDFR